MLRYITWNIESVNELGLLFLKESLKRFNKRGW